MLIVLSAVCGQSAMLLLALASWPGARALLGRDLPSAMHQIVRLAGVIGLALDIWLIDHAFGGLLGFAVVTFLGVCTVHWLVSAALCSLGDALRR